MIEIRHPQRIGLLMAIAPSWLSTACGHSEAEWQQAQQQIATLHSSLDAANKQHQDDQAQYAQDQQSIQDLQSQLQSLGVGLSKSEAEKAKLTTAMTQYEARLKQLDDMKARFKDLKTRLDKMTGAGLNVVIRHNKMVIQLPGDVLFDSGKDSLKPNGKTILKQVADIVRGDSTLSQRDFQIAGHTDREPYAGPFLDNWGLSLMRARTVLVFLIASDKGPDARGVPSGGALDPAHFAAAGYGQMDPVAGTVDQQTPDDEQKNRRVELVLQPDVAEMLNLKEIAGT
jgi:chemotaxis protein MotB